MPCWFSGERTAACGHQRCGAGALLCPLWRGHPGEPRRREVGLPSKGAMTPPGPAGCPPPPVWCVHVHTLGGAGALGPGAAVTRPHAERTAICCRSLQREPYRWVFNGCKQTFFQSDSCLRHGACETPRPTFAWPSPCAGKVGTGRTVLCPGPASRCFQSSSLLTLGGKSGVCNMKMAWAPA